jgi:hypothetical protein
VISRWRELRFGRSEAARYERIGSVLSSLIGERMWFGEISERSDVISRRRDLRFERSEATFILHIFDIARTSPETKQSSGGTNLPSIC